MPAKRPQPANHAAAEALAAAGVPEPAILATPSPDRPAPIPQPERVFGLRGATVHLGGPGAGQEYEFAAFTSAGIRTILAYTQDPTTQLLVAPAGDDASVGEMVAEAAVVNLADQAAMVRRLLSPTPQGAAALATWGVALKEPDGSERPPEALLKDIGEVVSVLSTEEREALERELFAGLLIKAEDRLLAFLRLVIVGDVPEDVVARSTGDELAAAIDTFFDQSGLRAFERTLKNSLRRDLQTRFDRMVAAKTEAGTKAPTTPGSDSTSSTK